MGGGALRRFSFPQLCEAGSIFEEPGQQLQPRAAFLRSSSLGKALIPLPTLPNLPIAPSQCQVWEKWLLQRLPRSSPD